MFHNIGRLVVLVAGLNFIEIQCSSVYAFVAKYLKTKHLTKSLVMLLRAVDRLALSIDCSAIYRLFTNLSIAQPPMDRAPIDRLCSKQRARSIE